MTGLATIQQLWPELILVIAATAIYLGGAFFPSRNFWSWIAAAGILLSAAALYQQRFGDWVTGGAEGSGPLVIDYFGYVVRWGVLAAGLLYVMLSAKSEADAPSPEYTGSLLLIFAGLMLTAVANEMVLLFLGLELVSIPTYVVLYLGRRDAAGQESTIKYFFLSILSSALLLYGFSFLYGVAQSTRLDDLYRAMAGDAGQTAFPSAARIGLVLVFAGLGFRLTAAPFHFYAPDVYQGTSNPNAGLLSTLPKVAGLVALIRVAAVSMPGSEYLGWKIALAMAMLTMTLGNILALWQDNLRRMLAYSSIAHAGYILVGVSVGLASQVPATESMRLEGLGASMFYLAVYIVATTGVFAALTYLGRRGHQVDGVDELAGLNRTHPLVALLLAGFMFSLSGIPPMSGFWGKFNLFLGALDINAGGPVTELRSWFLALAVVGVLNSAISLGYYLRVVGVMYFRAPLATAKSEGGIGAYATMVVCAVLVLGIGFFPGPLAQVTSRAGRTVHTAQTDLIRRSAAQASTETAALPAQPADAAPVALRSPE